MRSYFTQRVAFGSYKTLAYLGFSIATAWDWLMEGEENSLDHVKALLGLTCAAIEQVTLDSGSWTFATSSLACRSPRGATSAAPLPASPGRRSPSSRTRGGALGSWAT